jgi:hypothetical protein
VTKPGVGFDQFAEPRPVSGEAALRGGRKEIKEWFDAGAFEQQLGCGVGGSGLIENLPE